MSEDCSFCHHTQAKLAKAGQTMRSGELRDIYQCDECGCFYPRPRPDIKQSREVHEAHAKKYSKQHLEEHGPDKPWPALQPMNLAYKLKRALAPIAWPHDFRHWLPKHMPIRGHALDVGAADGQFYRMLDEIGFAVTGIETLDEQASKGRALGYDIATGSFPDEMPSMIESRRFNLIAFIEVIYYFVDIRQSLAKAVSMLLPGGYCLIKFHQAYSNIYHDRRISFFSRYGDYVQAMPTRQAMHYWIAQSGLKIVAEAGAPWIGGKTTLMSRLRHISPFGLPLINRNQADVLVMLAQKPVLS